MPRWGDWLGEQNASAFLDLFSHLNKMKDLLKGIGSLLIPSLFIEPRTR